MTRIRRTVLIAIALSMPAALAGCQKKEPPPVMTLGLRHLRLSLRRSPSWLLSRTMRATPTPRTRLPSDGPGRPSIPTQQKLQACCNAMRAQAKALGSSPEATQLLGAAATCDTFVKQVGPAGSAPELAVLRGLLKSVKLPVACQ